MVLGTPENNIADYRDVCMSTDAHMYPMKCHWRRRLAKRVTYEGSLEMRFVTKLISNDYLLETQKFASDVTNLETKFFCVSNDL